MGLFDFLKKEKTTPVKDLIWMKPEAKKRGSLDTISEAENPFVIAWSHITKEHYEQLFRRELGINIEIHLAYRLNAQNMEGRTIFFLEHHLLFTPEQELIQNLKPEKAIFFNSLEDPLLRLFGSDRVRKVMERMGLQEDEVIEATMISKSLSNAQKRNDTKLDLSQLTPEEHKWYESFKSR
jgi:hypothetical protein